MHLNRSENIAGVLLAPYRVKILQVFCLHLIGVKILQVSCLHLIGAKILQVFYLHLIGVKLLQVLLAPYRSENVASVLFVTKYIIKWHYLHMDHCCSIPSRSCPQHMGISCLLGYPQ